MELGDRMTRMTVYMTARQKLRLEVLSGVTRIPVATFIRDGIDKILERELPKYNAQLELPFKEAR